MPSGSLLGSSRVRNRSAQILRAFAVIGLLFWSSSELSGDTLTAAWDRNSESHIAGYILSYGTQSGNYSTSIDVGNVTTRQVVLYHASTGLWSILQSSTNTMRTVTWGSSSDAPMPGDYDGDGTTDLAVFRPSTGLWQILQSSTNTTLAVTWGMSTDIPVP